jgi:hypothetical protein
VQRRIHIVHASFDKIPLGVTCLGRASAGDPGRPSAGALAGFAGWLLTAIGATRHYALHEAVKHGRDERRMMNEKSSR